MIKTIKIIFAAILIISTTAIGPLRGEEYYRGLTVSASAGSSYITGYFSDYLRPGLNAKAGALYSLPFLGGNTYLKTAFSYYTYKLEVNTKSYLQQEDISIGGMLAYPLMPFILVNAGAELHGVYYNLSTKNTDKYETSKQPGVSASIGAMAYLGRGVGLSISSDYFISRLSDEYFRSVSINAGITYNYNDYRTGIDNLKYADKKINLFDRGNSEFRKKNFNEAKRIFLELHRIDSGYPGLDYYMKKIEEIEQNYKSAELNISQKNYIKAISFLESCSPYIKECEMKLFQQRKNLKVNVPSWEKEGIKLYDEKQYKECIAIMEKILIVDPENKNANIYLPRAINRNRALESLQSE